MSISLKKSPIENRRRLFSFVLLLTFSVVFGHNTIPHNHSDHEYSSVSESEQQPAGGLIDFLIAFYTAGDLGDDHMNGFEQGLDFNVDLLAPETLLDQWQCTIIEEQFFNGFTCEIIRRSRLTPVNRPPPAA